MELKDTLITILWSVLIIGTLIASLFIAPLLIGAGVIFAVYVVVKILNTDID